MSHHQQISEIIIVRLNEVYTHTHTHVCSCYMPNPVQESFSGKSIKKLVAAITTVPRACLASCKLTVTLPLNTVKDQVTASWRWNSTYDTVFFLWRYERVLIKHVHVLWVKKVSKITSNHKYIRQNKTRSRKWILRSVQAQIASLVNMVMICGQISGPVVRVWTASLVTVLDVRFQILLARSVGGRCDWGGM